MNEKNSKKRENSLTLTLSPSKVINATLLIILCIIYAAIYLSFTQKYLNGGEAFDNTQIVEDAPKLSFVRYFISKEEHPFLDLKAETIIFQQSSGLQYFSKPTGLFFNKDLKKTYFSSLEAKHNLNQKKIFLMGSSKLWDEESLLRAELINYSTTDEIIEAENNVFSKSYFVRDKTKILIKADKAISWSKKNQINYFGNVKGKIIEYKEYRPLTFFRSSFLNIDLGNSVINLNGDVMLKRGTMLVYGEEGKIFLENNNKDLKSYLLLRNVRLYQFDPKSNLKSKKKKVWRRAYGEKLEGFPKSEKIILSGLPSLIQTGDIIKGAQIILYETSKVIEVEDANTRFHLKE